MKKQRVVVGLSGGVDSAVAAALVQRAIGDRLTCVYVDHGLMREGESAEIEQAFGEAHGGARLVMVDAREDFLSALAGVTDPEAKRKIIGNLFVQIFEEESNKLKNARRVATRYDKTAESFLGFIDITSIRLWLRHL